MGMDRKETVDNIAVFSFNVKMQISFQNAKSLEISYENFDAIII